MKKKSTKKTTAVAKKTSAKKQLRRLPSVSGAACFWVNNGPVVSNMKELHQALIEMKDEQFAHHVNEHKNDFAVWMVEMFGEKAHAKKLHKAPTKKEAARVIKEALKQYR